MKVTKNYDDKNLALSVEGRIDTITSKDLEEEINAEFGNFESLTLDFADLEYISSAGLRILIATQKKLKAEDIPLAIKNVNEAVGEIFRMSGFNQLFDIS